MRNPNAPITLQIAKQKPQQSDFEKTIIQAVDESFSLLGKHGKQAIYNHLENAFNIKKQDIPSKIEDFTHAIEQTFGGAARLIEMKIIQSLHDRVQDFTYFPKKRDIIFTEYVASLQCFLTPKTQ
jgi:hypothetical protein